MSRTWGATPIARCATWSNSSRSRKITDEPLEGLSKPRKLVIQDTVEQLPLAHAFDVVPNRLPGDVLHRPAR